MEILQTLTLIIGFGKGEKTLAAHLGSKVENVILVV